MTRLEREAATVAAMVAMYCRAHHGPELCPACAELLDYVRARLERCPHGEDKPTCAACPIHCFRPELRDRIKEVMRWAGPRLPFRHPLLALRHLLDGLRRPKPRR